MSDPDFPAIFNQVHGFLSIDEAKLLYALASRVPAGGTIVEVGSFQGRSTVCLGLGAKEAGARVYAIDPHVPYDEGETHYGEEDFNVFLSNIAYYGLLDTVLVLRDFSLNVYVHWIRNFWGKTPNIDLLWIDGSHDYDDVSLDLVKWSRFLVQDGKIAIHDTAGHHPDVTRALADFMRDNEQWTIVSQVDAIAVLERVK